MPRAYAVRYTSAGCLPDDSRTFDTLQEARHYIEQEWEAVAGDDPAWNDDAGNGTPAYREAIDAIAGMLPGSVADDPRPGSLYRWTLESVLVCPECGEDVWDMPRGHKLARCWNTEGHDNGDTLAFSTMD